MPRRFFFLGGVCDKYSRFAYNDFVDKLCSNNDKSEDFQKACQKPWTS